MNTVSLGLVNTGVPGLMATVSICLAANVAPPAPVAVSATPIFPYLEKVTPERVAVPLWWSTRVRVAGEPAGGKAAVITGAGIPVVVTRNEFKKPVLTINVALFGLVKAGSPFATMRETGIVAVFPTPLFAENVRWYVPPVPTRGAPATRPGTGLNVTLFGGAPYSVTVGEGNPVVLTANDEDMPR